MLKILPKKTICWLQFEREQWINLNGTWTFDFDFGQSGENRQLYNSEHLGKDITVPFLSHSNCQATTHRFHQLHVVSKKDFNTGKLEG